MIHFKNALAASPERAGLHAELGEVLLRAGKVNPAIREFDEEFGAIRATCWRWCGAAKYG